MNEDFQGYELPNNASYNIIKAEISNLAPQLFRLRQFYCWRLVLEQTATEYGKLPSNGLNYVDKTNY
jgi:hypothetical protein